MNITVSLPHAASTSCMATSEPRASPSGFSWVTRTNVGVQQLLDADAPVDRVVVGELERRRVLEAQLVAHAALQIAVGGTQAFERGSADRLVPQDGDVDARVAQVRAGVDSG